MHALIAALLLATIVALPSHAAEKAIDKEVVVAATLVQVWDAWTTREGIVSFFALDARAQRTFVVVRFAPVDDSTTRVTLHHTGWGEGGEWDKAYAYFDRAWGNVLGGLKTRFEKGPQDWARGSSSWRPTARNRRSARLLSRGAERRPQPRHCARPPARPAAEVPCARSTPSSPRGSPPPRRARTGPGS